MLTIQMMYEEFKDVPESELDEKIENYILAYDNMCNLDKIKAANCDLPLPGKMKTMWQRIRKIVDRLHMKNHRSKCCQQKYSPDNVLKPDEDNMNTMAAEQLFSWMSRFKKDCQQHDTDPPSVLSSSYVCEEKQVYCYV